MPSVENYTAKAEDWPLARPFRISRGTKSVATVITVTLTINGVSGRGEGCPYPRYGETVDSALATLRGIDWDAFTTRDLAAMRHALLDHLPPGSARNALDCALWDLAAKTAQRPVWQLAGLAAPRPTMTCYTLSLDTPEAMAADARAHDDCPLLKLKLGDTAGDADRMRAVRAARPDARLVADANEGWTPDDLTPLIAAASAHRLELIEQPLPDGDDAALAGLAPAVPLCADESAAPGTAVAALSPRYQAVNIKLDKVGGLTAALETVAAARRHGLKIMIGSMVSTSLSMAPAALLAGQADWIDLDSPLLLARDRPDAMSITDGRLAPPDQALWG